MVPILDGNSEYIATCVKENRSLKNKIKKIKATAVNLNKCLKQIKLPILLGTCAPTPELPSNKNTMGET